MHNGPEFSNGFRKTYTVGKVSVNVVARHSSQDRMPRGHELVNQTVRGTGIKMISDPIYEWIVIVDQRRAIIRLNPNGTFSVAGSRQVYKTLENACVSFANLQ